MVKMLVLHLLPSGCIGCSRKPGLLNVDKFRRAHGTRLGVSTVTIVSSSLRGGCDDGEVAELESDVCR